MLISRCEDLGQMMGEPAASDLQPVTDNHYQLPKVLAEMIIILMQPTRIHLPQIVANVQ